jgi:hypothetical protein
VLNASAGRAFRQRRSPLGERVSRIEAVIKGEVKEAGNMEAKSPLPDKKRKKLRKRPPTRQRAGNTVKPAAARN